MFVFKGFDYTHRAECVILSLMEFSDCLLKAVRVECFFLLALFVGLVVEVIELVCSEQSLKH